MAKKLLCVLLAALMLLPVVACTDASSDATEAPTETSAPATEGESEGEGESDTNYTFDLPEKQFNTTLVFLTRDENEWSTVEIIPEEDSEFVPISEAVNERNLIVESKYKVTLAELKIDTTSHVSRVSQEALSPTGEFQAIVTSLTHANSMLQSCNLLDLLSDSCSGYLDFSKGYWDSNLAENLKVEGHLFMATGDILTSDNDATFTLLFNKSLVDEVQLENPYTLVDSKQWTMSKMYEMMQTATNDKDGDGTLTYDSDVCGFAFTQDIPHCLMYSGGLKVVDRDEDGEFTYVLDVNRASGVAEKANLLLSDQYAVDMNQSGAGIIETGQKCFGEGHALFFGECMQSVSRMRNYDVMFGIVPYPMYDEQQGEYYSMLHTTGGVVAIPCTVTGQQRADVAYMLEAIAYESVSTVTYLYYDLNLTSKNVTDEESRPMIDLIMQSRVYDAAYHLGIGGTVVSNLAGAMRPGKAGTVASIAKSAQKQINRDIKNLKRNLNKYKE